jgi:hypothetical protein
VNAPMRLFRRSPASRASALALVLTSALALGACDRDKPAQPPTPRTGESSGPMSGSSPRIDAPPKTEPTTPQTATQPALPSDANTAGRAGAAAERVDPGRKQ